MIQLMKLLVLTQSKHPDFGMPWLSDDCGGTEALASEPDSCPDYTNQEKAATLIGLLRRLASYLKQEAVLKMMPESTREGQIAHHAFSKWKAHAEKRRANSPGQVCWFLSSFSHYTHRIYVFVACLISVPTLVVCCLTTGPTSG